MIKGSVQKEDTAIITICAPNIGALKHIKQILMDIKGETNYFFLTIMT